MRCIGDRGSYAILTRVVELSALKTLGSTLAQDVEDSISEFTRLKTSLGDHIGVELLARSDVINNKVTHIKKVVDEIRKLPYLFAVRNYSF